jgi:hypothetical protein
MRKGWRLRKIISGSEGASLFFMSAYREKAPLRKWLQVASLEEQEER